MAEQNTVFRDPETPEAFLADRERTWTAFTGATLYSVIGTVVVLIAMAVFLL